MKPQTRSKAASFLFYIPFALPIWKALKGTGVRVADMRRDYKLAGLERGDLAVDPISQFETWFSNAVSSGLTEPNAMILATAGSDGRPAARTVLLKGFDSRGFVFFTNYQSRKGHHLEENPCASLLFSWTFLERQVEIRGPVTRVSPEETADYFYTRPIGSQIGAWASAQSTVIESRKALEEKVTALMEKYRGQSVPVPPFWGGFRVEPESIEFWQGRPSRLHDRFRYSRQSDKSWKVERLSP
ncbi:MAG: pyridoxamine 5'-phosphate oxidase [Opitutaceae bacterium]